VARIDPHTYNSRDSVCHIQGGPKIKPLPKYEDRDPIYSSNLSINRGINEAL